MRKTARLIPVLLLLGPAVLLIGKSAVPTPESVFGFQPGADYKLATYEQSINYFKKLAASSKYLTLVEAGKTTQGRTFYFALISDPKNLAKVDRYREIAQRLAHPEGLTDEEARKLAREGRAFVNLDCGLHATEVAGMQQAPKLAYDLIRRADEPRIKEILDNDIVILWPSSNPDGQQMVAEWYMKNVGTPYELSNLPRLYQDYVGHDNNRDAYMLNMIESRVLEHAWHQWEPQIIYVQHQTAPFPARIWLPPFSEPIGLHAPYIISREVNMIGMAMARSLEENGQVGAIHAGTFTDAWYAGYLDYAPMFTNIATFWTETALYGLATPHEYSINDLAQNFRDLRPQTLYSSPWPAGWWRLSDAVAYMESASLGLLEFAAKYRESVLYDRYQAGRDQIAKGKKDAPFAYFLPQDQRDPVAAVELLRRLAFNGVRVWQLTAPVTLDNETYPAGTWVVPTDQEFAAMARQVLDVQKYPDLRQYPGGPPERLYDAAGWTLPLQMGVKIATVSKPLAAEMRAQMKLLGPTPDPRAKPTPYNLAASGDAAPFDSVPGIGFNSNPAAAAIVPPPGKVSRSGPALAVDPAQNNTYRAINRAWKQGARVEFVAGSQGTGARYIISGLSEPAQSDLVDSLALVAERTAPGGTALKKPRVGLFQPWSSSVDEGWTRWLLEQYGFEFVTLHPEDFHAPLADKADVIILADDAAIPVAGGGGRGAGPGADQGARGAAAGRAGVAGQAGAAAQGAAAGQASGGRAGGGARAVRPEYAYTVTQEDLKAFEAFVRAGGTVVCFNRASRFIIQQFKLPVKNVVEGLRPEEFLLRGSIVEVTTDPTHPVMAGMPEKAAVFADSSPVFETLEGFQGKVLAKYQETGTPLLSGILIGEKHLQGKAAALDVELDKGHIVLIGFRPQWRAQSFGTFRIVFNSALYAR
ncbi:MAG: hypothetical protein LAP85_26990 [Acidobacteriia bacterium]|nr:hypothetical protein [Terriglobia bacterium]